ncbi:MAG: CopG family transcriptional regulator [Cyanobacteria bacterium P01_A01_bin.83]
MKRFSLRLTEAEYMKLKFYCEEIHVSMNDVIRELVRNWQPQINKVDQEVKQESKWR